MTAPSFGDNVRIRENPLTQKLGLAGLTGNVYGQTTPSVTKVEVIGDVKNDYAINVMLDERKEQLWFAADLVEFVDHNPGCEMVIGNRKLVRRADGEWDEVTSPENKPMNPGFISWLMRSFRSRRK